MPDPLHVEVTPRKGTIDITRETSRSAPTAVLENILKPFGNLLIRPGKPEPAGSPELEPHKSVYEHCEVKHHQVAGIHIYDITALPKASTAHKQDASLSSRSPSGARHKHIYYFAGGGWQSPASSDHWKLCSRFATAGPREGDRRVATTVSLVSYPLAPNTPAPAALPLLEKWYYALFQANTSAQDEEVIFAGDSSGANVAICLLLHVLNTHPDAPAPQKVLLISPSVDFRKINPAMKEVEKHDPILNVDFVKSTARAWAGGGRDTKFEEPLPAGAFQYDDPRVSPLLADVTVLARRGIEVHGVLGTYDVLAPDSVLFREKLDAAGVKGRWLEWEKQMHCFPLAASYGLPEGKKAVEWIIETLGLRDSA